MSMNQATITRIETAGVIAVVSVDNVDAAVLTAKALRAGGVAAVELTLRSDAAMEALQILCREDPGLMIGAGTVLTAQQVRDVKNAGADFAVAPGLNRATVNAARDLGLPFAPGICTPSDIEAAIELDCRVLKFFPAEPVGGLKYLRSMATPYAHCGLRFIPLGGINAENARDYLSDRAVMALGGSWIAPPALIQAADWDTITRRAKQAVEIVQQVSAIADQGDAGANP